MQTVVTQIRIAVIAVGAVGLLATQAQAQASAPAVALARTEAQANAVEVRERFTPDRLGASTNLSLIARFPSVAGAAPEPVRQLTIFAPAGLRIDARGADACSQAVLEEQGPAACPPTSRAGFGGGVGILRLPRETVRENFTLDFFFASTRPGHLALLAYANGTTPVVVEQVVIAREVRAPAPYGFGFSVSIPPVSTFPGAGPASIESVFATLGAADVAYYRRIHGHRRLVRVRGLLVPRSCPPGGFRAKALVDFLGGQSLTLDPTVACPAA